MAFYNIRVTRKRKSKFGNVLRWCLDYPVTKKSVDLKDISENGVLIKGWLVFSSEKKKKLVILENNKKTLLCRDRQRPDVILRVLNEPFENHIQLECGFEHTFLPNSSKFEICIEDDDRYTVLAEVVIESSMNVTIGTGDWLFLGNDTNDSIEQYTGKLLISRTELNNWANYFRKINVLAETTNTPICTLIAPSKEMVYEDAYPYKRGKRTPISQLQKVVPKEIMFIYPEDELKNFQARTFRKTDTHWSHLGAYKATILVAKKLNPTATELEELFSDDEYETKKLCGDLGSKLYPPQFSQESQLCSFAYRDHLLFDNKLTNFGRMLVMYNLEAYQGKTLLIFGSSSSYSMFNYLCRIYRTVVFVHSAGSICRNIVQIVEPTHILLQTNARFVIRAPSINFNCFDEVQKKLTSCEPPHQYVYRKKKVSLTRDRRLIKTLKRLKHLTDSCISRQDI